jgi:hypothetical protein
MKNLILFMALGINFIFIFNACTKNETAGGNSDTGAGGSVSSRTAGNIEMDAVAATCRATQPTMTYNMVSQMINNYTNNQLRNINASLGISDARAANFNIDSIENYICHIKSLVAASRCTSIKGLGIRFYYAAYSAVAEPGVPASYSRRHTLIMIPTYISATGIITDFDPTRIDALSCTPLPISNIPRSADAGNIIMLDNPGGNTYAQDHPVLGPPPPGGMGF